MKQMNGTMMQYFEWYLDCHQNLWNTLGERAEELASLGITSMWLPPAYKAMEGAEGVGYSVYDLYDLGEFDQKGTVKTKYGSKEDYLNCIISLQQAGIEAYADIVLNHKMGADMLQTIPANRIDWGDHNIALSNNEIVRVATKFTFPGRHQKYSDFTWNWTHFSGIDYNDKSHEHAIYKFKDKQWNDTVDEEFGNFDYLMGADLDFSNPEVVEECKTWAKWYLEETGVNGFRLDAVKHISADFYRDFIKTLRDETKKELFTVGEYWSSDVNKLHKYIETTEGEISLFDVPLHYQLQRASLDENFDMSTILEGTLVKENPLKAVTFVDNHDTQPGQALQSFIEPWFKQSAYSIILLRNDGYPCVFYGDFYGILHDNIAPVKDIETLLNLRKEKAYGSQHDYFDDVHCIGWTREGDTEHLRSGMAVLLSNAGDGEKRMYVGEQFAGEVFIDALSHCDDEVTIAQDGYGLFKVKEKSVSIWVLK